MDFAERVRRKKEFDASLMYGTREFNLRTKRFDYKTMREKNDNNWLEENTDHLKPDCVEDRLCPLCGGSGGELLFVKSGFPHLRCECGLVYVNKILTKEESEKFYCLQSCWGQVLETMEQQKMNEMEAKYVLDVVESYEKSSALAICDIGCGPGRLLEEARKRGHSVFGIEPEATSQKVLREKNIDFFAGFFPLPQDLGKKFDVIFLLNTLEHMREPLDVIRGLKKYLNERGRVFISVPNLDALVNRILHEKAGVFGGHSHIQFFNVATLSKLLENSGFRVLESETVITEIGTINNYLSYTDPYYGDSKENFQSFISPEIIYANNMGRNVNVLAELIEVVT